MRTNNFDVSQLIWRCGGKIYYIQVWTKFAFDIQKDRVLIWKHRSLGHKFGNIEVQGIYLETKVQGNNLETEVQGAPIVEFFIIHMAFTEHF